MINKLLKQAQILANIMKSEEVKGFSHEFDNCRITVSFEEVLKQQND